MLVLSWNVQHLSEQDKEDDEQGEQGNGLSEGKSQESIANQLLCNVRVAGSTVDQRSEHDTETCTDSGKGNGGASSTNHLGSSQDAHGAVLDELNWNGGSLVRREGANRLGPDSTDQAGRGQAKDNWGLCIDDRVNVMQMEIRTTQGMVHQKIQ